MCTARSRVARIAARVGELLEQVGIPRVAGESVPAPVVGRPAATRADRARAGVRTEAADRRRADHRARRDGAGPGARPARVAAARPRAGDAVHHPRPVGAHPRLSTAGGHVRRSHRRDRASSVDVFREPAAPVQPGARRCVPHDRRSSVAAPAERSGGRPARSVGVAHRLPVPPALRGGGRRLPHHRRAPAAGRVGIVGGLGGVRARGGRDERRPRRPADHDTTDTLVSVRGAHVRFGGGRGGGTGAVRAVDGVDLEVARGEVLALVGESGCGKTTLIRSMIGLEPLAEGSITVDGHEVTRNARRLRALRRQAQMIFQDPTGRAQPAPHDLRGGGRRTADPSHQRRRDRTRRRCARQRGPPPAGAIPASLPARALRRAAPTGVDRRGDGARPGGAARRRAGRQPRRVHPRRDPGADAFLRRRRTG